MRRVIPSLPQHLELFERSLLDYAHNLLQLRFWKHEHHGFEDNPLVLKLLKKRRATRRLWAELVKYTSRTSLRTIRPPKEPMASGLRRLGELLKLPEVDLAILQFALALSDNQTLRDIAISGSRRVSSSSFGRIVGAVIGHGAGDVALAIGPKGRLVRCGLLELVMHGDLEDRLKPKDGLVELLASTELTREKLLDQFLPNVAQDDPPWLDHSHLDKEIAIAQRLLSAAIATGAKGVNILLYGDTGTGKTELAKRLAREVGVPLYAARAGATRGDELAKPSERMSSLLLGLRIVEAGGAMVLFDELEDLFDRSIASLVFGKIGSVTAKDTFNRLFEDNPAPVIWTTNHVSSVDRAFLRRFSHAIAVRPGGIRQRARVLKQSLGLPLDEPHAELDQLAERCEVSPAQVVAAVHAARLVGDPPIAHLAPLLEGSCRLVTGRRVLPRSGNDDTYMVNAINASIDVEAIAERLASWKQGASPGVTMCLYGSPGTGKSEYVRYLARRLGRRLIVKRASDILDCYVGGSEKNIAEAFEEASTDDAILVFDEVDSLLQDRRDARHSWEVTQVNEMLQQLEAFPGIVACTTNRWDGLDAAVLRRFTFKIELKPPTVDQVTRLFWTMFETVVAETRTAEAEDAVRAALSARRPTAGDLAAIRRRLSALSIKASVAQLIDELGTEARARSPVTRGFASGAQEAR